ncbi:MAG: response regulator transcription factor [bacterium]|jgi:DNA-binding response OmpR family regulator
MAKILVVEDEPDMRFGLEHNLRFEGYQVICAEDGKTGLEMARYSSPDLVLLDIMLPGMSGLEVLRQLRKERRGLPVILVTAKGQEMDKIIGLESGADDYITKPFSVKELLARVNAVLRRYQSRGEIGEYSFGDVKIDFKNMQATKGGRDLEFTHREFEIMKVFVRHKNEVIPRSVLLDEVWGYESKVFPNTRTVDTHIAKLRKKIEDDTENPHHIITVHRMGYRFMD